MTMLSNGKTVRRETLTILRDGPGGLRPVIIELGAHSLRVKLKGRRTWYEVSNAQIYNRGVSNAAEDRRREKAAAKEAKRV
jgi:hypothetical protein